MTNETTIKVPQKYQHMVESITYSNSRKNSYNILLNPGFVGLNVGYIVGHPTDRANYIHSQKEAMAFIRSAYINEIAPFLAEPEPETTPTPDTSATIEVSKVRGELVRNMNLWLKSSLEEKEKANAFPSWTAEHTVAFNHYLQFRSMAQALFLMAPDLGIDLSNEFPQLNCDCETSPAPAEEPEQKPVEQAEPVAEPEPRTAPTPDTSATIEVSKVREVVSKQIRLWLHETNTSVIDTFTCRSMAGVAFDIATNLGVDLFDDFPEFAQQHLGMFEDHGNDVFTDLEDW